MRAFKHAAVQVRALRLVRVEGKWALFMSSRAGAPPLPPCPLWAHPHTHRGVRQYGALPDLSRTSAEHDIVYTWNGAPDDGG